MKTIFDEIEEEAENYSHLAYFGTGNEEFVYVAKQGYLLGASFVYDKYTKMIMDLVIENQGLKLYKDDEKERMIKFGEYIQNYEGVIYTIAGVYNDFLKEEACK